MTSVNSSRKNALAAKKYLESRFKYLKSHLAKLWQSPHSDFYRSKYEAASLQLAAIKESSNWLKIPYLDRNDLEKHGPYERLYVNPEKIFAIRNTSGTTSCNPSLQGPDVDTARPLIMLRSEHVDTQKYLAPFKFKAMLSLLSYARFHTFVDALGKIGKVFASGDIHDMPRSALLAKTIKADALLGPASILVAFHPVLKRIIPPQKIRLIILHGEYTTQLQWENLGKLFPNAKIISTYSSVESGFKEITFPCPETAKYHSRYHIAGDAGFIEISPEGEIILTTFFDPTPLIRYKTGDLGAFVGEPCACGRKEPLINVYGRANFDSLRIKGLEIRADEVEKGIEQIFKIKNPEFKLHIFERPDSFHEAKLELVLKKKPEKFLKMPDQMLATMVAGKIAVSANLSLADAVENGLLKSFNLGLVSEFPLEQKQKRIILHEF